MKTIIIGGAALGMGVAARLKRNDPTMEIVVYQKHDYVSLGACGLPYFVADNFQDPDKLIARQISQFEEIGIIIRQNSQVIKLDSKNKMITFLDENQVEKTDFYDEVVIATGARPIVPNIINVKHPKVFTLTTLEDGVRFKKALATDQTIQKVVVIGAGFIGLEMCETLRHLQKDVTLIEMASNVVAKQYDEEISALIKAELIRNDVEVLLEQQVTEVLVNDKQLVGVKLASGNLVSCDAILLSVGFIPNTSFLQETGLKMLANQAIVVNEQGQTNLDHVWSGGDCATSKNYLTGEDIYSPLATVASKMARVIADNICGKPAKFVGSLQTAIIRVFGVEAVRTGLTTVEAVSKGYDIKNVMIKDKDRTHYVPNQADLTLKLIYDQKNQIILGAQMVGSNQAVLRIYGLVAIIWNKVKVDSILEQLDLPYAPPFSRTTDIIHIAISKLLK
ncbi:CoA-disulfide reductase [Spiroplasma chrysopicola]|uniref:NADH oxidase n=1 Tax=Spiroplasma chrysopicola DF-1 TaxID=1276227 RepID=R4UG50_9MOLU|nr:CoA-disulfide reductase [Spiroplasma chrysopicola]AGM25115.1 NADH oxidase [Spiroplasma chrysopicola DF-1]